MFDWDEDYDGLIAAVPEDRPLPVAAPQRRSRTVIGFWIVGGLLALGIGAYAVSGKAIFPPGQAQPDLLAALPFGGAGVLPELQVLGDSQAASFQAGLRGFSAPELTRYAGTTRADLSLAPEFMRPYLADALALIEHEMSRRGL